MIAADTTGMRTSRATVAARIAPQWDLVALSVLTVLAVVIRARGIGTTNLWLDEANSWLLTTYSVGDMLANIRHSPASPLYFLLLKLWALAWGDSTVALRAFSLLVSLPLLPLVYVLGRQTVGRAGGLVAALLLALSPLQLYFAQEARVYMLATLLSVLATVGYLGWRADAERRLVGAGGGPRRHGWLWLYGASAAASLYTLPLVALLYLGLAADALLVMARERSVTLADARRAVFGSWVIAQVAVALVCAPLFLAIDTGTAASSQAWRGPMGTIGAAKGFLEFFLSFIHGLYFYPWDLVPAIVDKWGHAVVLRLVVVFPLAILALVTAFAYPPYRAARGAARALYWALLLPLVIGAVVSVWHELALTRYLLFVSPYLALLLAAGIVRAPRWIGGLVLASFVWASIYGVSQYHTIHRQGFGLSPDRCNVGGLRAVGRRDRRAAPGSRGAVGLLPPRSDGIVVGDARRRHARQRASSHVRGAYVACTRLPLPLVWHTARFARQSVARRSRE